jgi:pimeloyl-ACP methyl ester carboxylesterase
MRLLYLHGWASGPKSAKATLLANALAVAGVQLHVPNLNRPSFGRLTFSNALAEVDETVAVEPGRWMLIGSSMGGYLAARWAEMHPSRVDKLVLLCPGFDLIERLPVVFNDDQLLARWERDGTFAPGYGPDGPASRIGWDFVADARKHPARPRLSHPTLIIHGKHDDVIPLDSSRRVAAECADSELVRLVEVDDGHDLVASSELIVALTMEWLGIAAPAAGKSG